MSNVEYVLNGDRFQLVKILRLQRPLGVKGFGKLIEVWILQSVSNPSKVVVMSKWQCGGTEMVTVDLIAVGVSVEDVVNHELNVLSIMAKTNQ